MIGGALPSTKGERGVPTQSRRKKASWPRVLRFERLSAGVPKSGATFLGSVVWRIVFRGFFWDISIYGTAKQWLCRSQAVCSEWFWHVNPSLNPKPFAYLDQKDGEASLTLSHILHKHEGQ